MCCIRSHMHYVHCSLNQLSDAIHHEIWYKMDLMFPPKPYHKWYEQEKCWIFCRQRVGLTFIKATINNTSFMHCYCATICATECAESNIFLWRLFVSCKIQGKFYGSNDYLFWPGIYSKHDSLEEPPNCFAWLLIRRAIGW